MAMTSWFYFEQDDINASNLSYETPVESICLEGVNTAQDERLSDFLQTMAMRSILKTNIQSVYLDIEFYYRNLYHVLIEPLHHDTSANLHEPS